MSAKGIWIAFGIGVSAGAAVALLYAPQTGAKARRQLGKSIDDGVDYLEDAAAYLKQQADTLAKQSKKTIKLAKGHAADISDIAKSHASNIADKVSDASASASKVVQSLM